MADRIAERNLDAEARAVEAGHHAWVQPGGWVKVVSDSYGPDKWYEVTFLGHIDGFITFTCTPHGRMAYKDDHLFATSSKPGVVPCMHAALAARRLERERLAVLDVQGRWSTTALARSLQCQVVLPANPIEGLPQ